MLASDGAFHVVLGSFMTAAGTDVAVSMYQIGRGTAREAAFGSWWQDSPVAFAATKSAVAALFAYQLQRLHRTRPKTAFILGIASTSVEAALVARSARIRQPGPLTGTPRAPSCLAVNAVARLPSIARTPAMPNHAPPQNRHSSRRGGGRCGAVSGGGAAGAAAFAGAGSFNASLRGPRGIHRSIARA